MGHNELMWLVWETVGGWSNWRERFVLQGSSISVPTCWDARLNFTSKQNLQMLLKSRSLRFNLHYIYRSLEILYIYVYRYMYTFVIYIYIYISPCHYVISGTILVFNVNQSSFIF